MNENSAASDRIPVADRAAKTMKGKAMGRMSRTTKRPALKAVLVLAMALAALLGTAVPGFAAPVSHTGERGTGARTATMSPAAVAGNRICIISAASTDGCDSTYRELIVDSTNQGDTEGCTFTWKMYWGDGTTETVTDDGGPAELPTIVKAIHFYKEPAETTIYDVYWDAVSVTGGCYIGSGYGYFILVVPPR
jgi:hypothetical protein